MVKLDVVITMFCKQQGIQGQHVHLNGRSNRATSWPEVSEISASDPTPL